MRLLLTVALLLGSVSAETKPRVLLTDHAVDVSAVSQNDSIQALGTAAKKICKLVTG